MTSADAPCGRCGKLTEEQTLSYNLGYCHVCRVIVDAEVSKDADRHARYQTSGCLFVLLALLTLLLGIRGL